MNVRAATILATLTAAITTATAQNVRQIEVVTDITEGAEQYDRMRMWQAESVDYIIHPKRRNQSITFPAGAEPVWHVFQESNPTSLYVNATGTISNAKATISLTPAQSNIPTGDYRSVVSVYNGATYMGVIADASLTVEYSPASATVEYVGTYSPLDGSLLTNMNASLVFGSGTIPTNFLPAAALAASSADGTNDLIATAADVVGAIEGADIEPASVSGDGSGLTGLDGSAITAGTVADARIASTIARATGDTYTGTHAFGWATVTGISRLDASDGSPAPALSVNASGRVGIGTDTPERPLHILGNVNGAIAQFDSAASIGQIVVQSADTSACFGSGDNGSEEVAYVGPQSGVNKDNITITESGRVGIGTTIPSGTLDVVGTWSLIGGNTTADAAAKTLRIGSASYLSSEEPVAWLVGVADAATNKLQYGGGVAFGNAATLHAWNLATNTTSTTGQEVMRLDGEGLYVGDVLVARVPPLSWTLPAVMYAATGLEANIYFDNLLSHRTDTDVLWDVDGSLGRQWNHRWAYTPTVDQDATNVLTVSALNRLDFATLVTDTLTVRQAASQAFQVTRPVTALGAAGAPISDFIVGWGRKINVERAFDRVVIPGVRGVDTPASNRAAHVDVFVYADDTVEAAIIATGTVEVATNEYVHADVGVLLSTSVTPAMATNFAVISYRLRAADGRFVGSGRPPEGGNTNDDPSDDSYYMHSSGSLNLSNDSGDRNYTFLQYGKEVVLLAIGDSTTAGTTKWQQDYPTMSSADPDMDVTMIGTQGSNPIFNEGYSGQRWNWMATNDASPFVWSGVFDFERYCTGTVQRTPDVVTIHLGINDVFSADTDEEVAGRLAVIDTHAATMIDGIHAHDPDIAIGLMLTIPPNFNQDGFGDDYYNNYSRHRVKANQVLAAKHFAETYGGREDENVYCVPVNICLDTRNGFPAAEAPISARNTNTVLRATNGVHPDATGYKQMGDQVWAWMKWWVRQR